MIDATPPESDHQAHQSPVGPPPIVVVESPAGSWSLACGVEIMRLTRSFVVVMCMIVGAMILFESFVDLGASSYFWPVVLTGALICSLLSGPGIVRRMRWRRDALMRYASRSSGGTADPAAIVQGAFATIGGLCRYSWMTNLPRRHGRGEFQQFLADEGVPSAITIVDASIIDAVRSIERPAVFVEPEPFRQLLEARSWRLMCWVLITLLFTWHLFSSLAQSDWIGVAISAPLAWVFGTTALEAFGVSLYESSTPIMGMGVFIDARNRRWSVLDSCAYFYRIGSARAATFVVELIGPAGLHTMYFRGADDPAFMMFWQRWMHPHPRPDLV